MASLFKVKHLHGVISYDEWNGEIIEWFIKNGDEYECIAVTELNKIPNGKFFTTEFLQNVAKEERDIIEEYLAKNF